MELVPPAPVSFRWIPRRAGGHRRATVLAPPLAREFTTLTHEIERRADRALSEAVIADRLSADGVTRESWRSARRRFAAEVRRLATAIPGPVVLLDVRRCFESIAPSVVEDALLAAGCRPSQVAAIRRFLERLGDEGVQGLPIGPLESSVLANPVLACVDEALRRTGVPVLRWVDDIVAFPGRQTPPESVIRVAADALAEQGLSLAAEKTRVIEHPDALADLPASLSTRVERVSSPRR